MTAGFTHTKPDSPAFHYGEAERKKISTTAQLTILRDALDRIACWSEGPEVRGYFDEPGAAQIAREALAEAGYSQPPQIQDGWSGEPA